MQLIDVHGHIGKWTFPMHCSNVGHLTEYMKRCGITQTIVSSSSAITYDFVEGNQRLAEEIENVEGVWGYIVLNPHYLEESLGELLKYKDNSKFVGVKLHPEQQVYRLVHENVLRLMERVSHLQLPVLVHTFPGQTSDLCRVAQEFPQVKFIMGHMGGNEWMDGIEAVRDLENVWLEPCSSFPDAGKIRRSLEVVGAKRVLFGTDSTLLNPAFIGGLLHDAGLDEGEYNAIAHANAQALFRF
jgi:predicted TIM-barrel fold metal-dependent hydrolase